MNHGSFIISLDLELLWGVTDEQTKKNYAVNIRGVRQAIPAILDLFARFGINATFAVVGFLLLKNIGELKKNLPASVPAYRNLFYSPYELLKNHPHRFEDKNNELFFAPDLLKLITTGGHHEIASHTLSHYYCLEQGQTVENFIDDLSRNLQIAANLGVELKSIIFPRNQYNRECLNACKSLGFKAYRGCENSWFHHSATTEHSANPAKKALRLLDSYLNISGHHVYTPPPGGGIINLAASRFLRPYNNKLKFFDRVKLRRITNSMEKAAREKKIFHLWWHPHNFGVNLGENLKFLQKVLTHFKKLNEKYGFLSRTMAQTAEEINRKPMVLPNVKTNFT